VTYFFETYGCQMNSAESAALELALRERGWEKADYGTADLYILNTCSVRQTAETRLKGRLAQYEALKKKSRFTLVVAGCMASRLGERLKDEFPSVDYVMGTDARSIFPLILEAAERSAEAAGAHAGAAAGSATPAKTASPREIASLSEKAVFSFSSSHLEEGAFRSFVPIMHGCNNFCSYCIVPYVRGREVSRGPASIAEEIALLSEKGVREITLLGQNVNSYQHEELDFPGLLRHIAAWVKGGPIARVRFLSANSKDFSRDTIAVMAEHSCFCRHIHLPVQHGSNRVLAAMNRRYTRESFLALSRELRAAIPGLTLSTDILVGFPGETEADMEEVFALMEEVRFLYAYMYYYNPREGTAAYDLPNRVPDKIKRDRLARVIALQNAHTTAALKKRVGSHEKVLVDGISRKNADEVIGRTEKDEMVAFPGTAALTGSFADVELYALRGRTFRGKLLASTI
jgi:tRNA-2-methylthio-N6-dimethylallyladenosine synthase